MSNRKSDKVSRKKDSLRTWLRLLACESQIEQHLRSLFRHHFSVTLPQFDVLSELEYAGRPLTMSELSQELMVSNGNITGVIDRLVKLGLVARQRPAHDRRIQHIDLTKEGKAEFKKIARQHEIWITRLFADLSQSDMRQLQQLLLRARSSVTKGIESVA